MVKCILCGKQEFTYDSEKDLATCACGAVTKTVIIEPTPTHKIGNQEYFGTGKRKRNGKT